MIVEAARQALYLLEEFVDDPRCQGQIDATSAALRQALEQPADEPVAMRHSDGEIHVLGSALVPVGSLLYANPQPAAQWVGLTDDELELLNDCGDTDSYKFARAIETKLKEKNT
jgi:hypothetical protein